MIGDLFNETVTLSTGLNNVSPGFAANVENDGNPQKDRDEIERLQQTSDLYQAYAPQWQKYIDAYVGGPNIARKEYLKTHVRESPDDYSRRVGRMHYLNYCKPLVDFFTFFIYSETIERDGADDNAWYQEFLKDVNLKGDDIVSFMKMVSDDAQIFGMIYVLVDTPQNPFPDGRVPTVAEAQLLGLRPYWSIIKPLEVIDWDTDAFDHLTYLKRREDTTERNSPGGAPIKYLKFTEWYTGPNAKDNTVVVSYVEVTDSKEPKLVREKGQKFHNSLGKITIEVVRHERSKEYKFLGEAFLRDFADNNIAVLNLTSLIDEFNYKQCFNILAREDSGAVSLPLLDGNEGVIGTGNVMTFPNGTKAPTYITPPADPAKFLQSERDYIIQQMFKRAAQDTMSQLFNGEGASGFSQAQNFSKTVPFISNRADVLEAAEHRLMIRTMVYIGKTWAGTIRYKDRYELTNISDALTQLMMLFRDLQLPSPTFVKEEMKRLVHEMDGKIPTDKLAQILKEIDDLDWTTWQDTQKQALIGKPSSPGEQNAPKGGTTVAESAAEARSSNAPAAAPRKKNNK